MIDHITLHVTDLGKSKAFYLSALAPLGYTLAMEFPEWSVAGLGADGFPDLWLKGDGEGKPTHLGFRSKDHAGVDAFYEAALAAGAKDNGAPGPRPEYHKDYYGAFVFDPDGNNIEAVCHDPL